MDPDQIRSDPDDQAARGLSPEEQRAERDRESQQQDDTKFHEAVELEREEREQVAGELDEPPEPREDG
ncbi:MAG: hypothetical protein ABR583_07970 [Gaiellaceae bacterium]